VPHEEIKDISVDMTIRGGEVVFDRQVGHEIGGGAVQ
jgi:hypothetical protein